MAKIFSIYEAKARLSELLRLVKESELHIVISERGKPIAKVIPYQETQEFKEKFEEMSVRGMICRRKQTRIPKGIKRAGALKRFTGSRE